MKSGMRSALVAQQLLELGSLADQLQRGAEEPGGGLAAGGEQVGRDERDVVHVGHRAVGERRGGEARSSRRRAVRAGSSSMYAVNRS